MPRTPVWTAIATTLAAEIGAGHYRAGDKLPTEAALAARFGVNRHTVRRALADMAERGLVRSRRGAGVFVAAAPTDYPIGRRVRFHQNIRASGRLPEKRVLRVETRPCDPLEARALGLAPGAPVVVYEGLSLANGTALAHFVSTFPAGLLPGLADTLAEVSSVTEALRRNGIADYLRAETRVSAERASPTQALHLGLREGDPLLRTEAINVTPEGVRIERGLTWFAGDRVTLSLAND
ncbi:phosphonate metabolism transcriptional regulator PhnF [Sinisalibacter lacisalsi]|uniref:Phosphonate metabolism transcriptional regulator PhnF n=1 Tax=Sinisalibacter lacisalsi TaxID=1526570 RepID=A0ABQ1QKG9_9RHOB|nr:phosphonate metabolism transcriptional regulator PhnF [Sinisalibacter lacisalsi]GGD31341.1 phosphonate metabolism transcriptional regulator PhnF [Sinisalibacter lacisalsi]